MKVAGVTIHRINSLFCILNIVPFYLLQACAKTVRDEQHICHIGGSVGGPRGPSSGGGGVVAADGHCRVPRGCVLQGYGARAVVAKRPSQSRWISPAKMNEIGLVCHYSLHKFMFSSA